jgi:hypothetical protein
VTDQDKENPTNQAEASPEAAPLDEFAELEQDIRRRLQSNQRFLERFMDEEFDDDEDLPEASDDESEEEEG